MPCAYPQLVNIYLLRQASQETLQHKDHQVTASKVLSWRSEELRYGYRSDAVRHLFETDTVLTSWNLDWWLPMHTSQILYIIFFAHPFLPFICPLGCEPLRTGGVPRPLVNLTAWHPVGIGCRNDLWGFPHRYKITDKRERGFLRGIRVELHLEHFTYFLTDTVILEAQLLDFGCRGP